MDPCSILRVREDSHLLIGKIQGPAMRQERNVDEDGTPLP